MARRRPSRSRPRSSAAPASSGGGSGAGWLLLAGAAAIAGVGIYIYTRPAAVGAPGQPNLLPGGVQGGLPTNVATPNVPAATPPAPVSTPTTVFSPPPPSTPGAAIPPATNATVPPAPSNVTGTTASSTLVARLRGNSTARQIFALQAAAYSYGLSNALPDGIEGPITDGIIGAVNAAGSFTNEPRRYTTRSIANLRAVLVARGLRAPRLLPFTLPADVIQSVNQAAASVDNQALLLQVFPTAAAGAMAPGGKVLPFVSPTGYGIVDRFSSQY